MMKISQKDKTDRTPDLTWNAVNLRKFMCHYLGIEDEDRKCITQPTYIWEKKP